MKIHPYFQFTITYFFTIRRRRSSGRVNFGRQRGWNLGVVLVNSSRISSVVIKLLKSLIIVVAAYTGGQGSRGFPSRNATSITKPKRSQRGLICLETPLVYTFTLKPTYRVSFLLKISHFTAIAFVNFETGRLICNNLIV